MKFGTKVGCVLVAFSIILSVWVISGMGNEASTTDANGFVTSEGGTVLEAYTGAGGAIAIPSGITTIQSGVFANQTSITSVSMSDTVTTMGSGVFSGCINLVTARLSTNLSALPDSAFSDCTALNSVSYGNISSIGARAFYGCSSLTNIRIPATVSSIGSSAFEGCTSLTSIDVDDGSAYYSSVDGVLYNISGSTVIWTPAGIHAVIEKPKEDTTVVIDPIEEDEEGTIGEVDLEFEDEEEEPAVEETPSTEPAPTTESTSTSGGASGSGGHVKDSTPTTADGDFDPRYALSLGFLLLGVAFILYSKRRKMNYVKEGRSSR